MVTQGTHIDYYALTEEQKHELGCMIAADNIEAVNKDFQTFEIPNTFYVRYGKRILDTLLAIVALIISAPINLIIMIVTWFDVGSPVLFHQQRIGKDHKVFWLTKFRNMTNETDLNGVLLPAYKRVTKWGNFVRKTSLDELLNFWSILKGDMAIIGPRPMPIDYDGRFSQKHDMRHQVRPGLECPMHNDASGACWEDRFDNDVWYVQHISLKTDMKLIGKLVAETFWGEKKKMRGQGMGASGGDFMGYFKDGHVMTSDVIPRKYFEHLFQGTSEVAITMHNAELMDIYEQ